MATGLTSPTGRKAVTAAILAAAADLFAERGAAATAIRDIAARSKVNHGLVFRHFGSKENLVAAVLEHLAANLTDLRHSGAPADVIELALDRQMRVIARILLDGYPAQKLQLRFPTVAELIEQIRPGRDSDLNARLAVANATALQFGWYLFGLFRKWGAGGGGGYPRGEVVSLS